MRCVFHVDESPTPLWSDDLDPLPVTGACIDQDGRSYVVLEVDWFGADRGYAGERQMALIAVTEVEDTPLMPSLPARTGRRPGRVVVAALKDQGTLAE
jgi:hypothetical protein